MNKEYFHDHYGGSRQTIATENVLFNPSIIPDSNRDGRLRAIVQRKGWFVVQAPGAYHIGFNVGYNVTEATKFVDFS